jgi:transposase
MSQNIYVGVDWHKRTSTWVAINEDRKKIYSRSWGCTPEDVQDAIASLPTVPSNIKLAVEPVCGWRWMTEICIKSGIDTKVANTIKLRQIAESNQKTDKNDAQVIAELLRMEYLPEAYRAPDEIQALRALVRQRGFFVRVGAATKCRIHGICTNLGAHNTSDRPLLKEAKLKMQTGEHTPLRDLYDFMESTSQFVKRSEEMIYQNIKQTPTYNILISIPGIGPVTAAAIMAEVGDFKRFKTSKQLISYAGLYPKERSTGGKQHFVGMSKGGSRILRYSIVEAAMRIRDTDKTRRLYSHYAAALERGKTAKQARIVVAHKMLSIAWFLVANQKPYDDCAVKSAQREMTS